MVLGDWQAGRRRFAGRWMGGMVSSLALASAVAVLAAPASAQQQAPADGGAGTINLAPVQVQGTASAEGVAIQDDRVDNPNQVPNLDKTGTPISDVPGSVHIIPREVLTQQGDTMLRQGLYNAPGVNFGGQDSKGFYDHFEIRGLNAQIFSDGFSDGDQLGGISHSLNGVQSVEVLEGPGSALFGSGPPGGTINIIHYTPSDEFHYGGGLELGTDNSQTASAYATGATNLPGLDFRVDATVAHADGFRDLESEDYELRPSFRWRLGDHTLDFSIDARHIHETPDSYGIIYFHGQPLTSVPDTAKYSSPFATSAEDIFRPEIIDKWRINDFLTVNNRFSYLLRTLDTLGNGDSSNTKVTGTAVTGRQLRRQNDRDNSYDYQLEPVWKFATGPVTHTLLTGFEYQHQTISTDRTTADLPNIANAFQPVPPETSPNALAFLCDATHSCDNDQLVADYTSASTRDRPGRCDGQDQVPRRCAPGFLGYVADAVGYGARRVRYERPAVIGEPDAVAQRHTRELECRRALQGAALGHRPMPASPSAI